MLSGPVGVCARWVIAHSTARYNGAKCPLRLGNQIVSDARNDQSEDRR